MIRRSDYEDLTADELRQLIKEHKLALKILQSLYGECRAEEEKVADLDILIDILLDNLGYSKHTILFTDAKALGKSYLEDSKFKKRHGRKNIELLATVTVAEVLDYYDYSYEIDELLSVFGVDKKRFFREKSRIEEYASTVYWKQPKRR